MFKMQYKMQYIMQEFKLLFTMIPISKVTMYLYAKIIVKRIKNEI